jgi:hypothetical protein
MRSKRIRRKFVRDLTRTRHMATVSAVILVSTFMPLLSMPDVQEFRAFRTALMGAPEARAAAPGAYAAAPAPAARERSPRIRAESEGAPLAEPAFAPEPPLDVVTADAEPLTAEPLPMEETAPLEHEFDAVDEPKTEDAEFEEEEEF